MILKAISLWQPWASLWAAGIKIHETRDWYMSHRGLLAVHAAKHRDADAALLYDDLCKHPEYSQRIMDANLPPEFSALPFGAIIGVVSIVAVSNKIQRLNHLTSKSGMHFKLAELECLLGNFSPGRFAWEAENPRMLKTPIPWKGKQGFFNVEIPDALLG